jgi:hypothetical protein
VREKAGFRLQASGSRENQRYSTVILSEVKDPGRNAGASSFGALLRASG